MVVLIYYIMVAIIVIYSSYSQYLFHRVSIETVTPAFLKIPCISFPVLCVPFTRVLLFIYIILRI